VIELHVRVQRGGRKVTRRALEYFFIALACHCRIFLENDSTAPLTEH
jgi:hypothetical protein